jgi:hypothetical protein
MGLFQTEADKARADKARQEEIWRAVMSPYNSPNDRSTLRESSTPGKVKLQEHVAWGSPKVDLETGIITGAKLLGRVSKNGREYSDQALNDAVRLYEGATINLDHPTTPGNRGFLEGIAVARNVKRGKDGVYGDLHTIKSHPATPPLLEWASRFPKQFGLSHNADGVEVRKGGKNVVESLDRVVSIDVVRNPATTGGLFEGLQRTVAEPPKYPANLKEFCTAIGGRRPVLEMDGMAHTGLTSMNLDDPTLFDPEARRSAAKKDLKAKEKYQAHTDEPFKVKAGPKPKADRAAELARAILSPAVTSPTIMPPVQPLNPATGTASDPVADKALNGAQIDSLLTIVQQVADGTLSREAGRALIMAAFPLLKSEQIDAIINAIEVNPSVDQAGDAGGDGSAIESYPATIGEFCEALR